MLVVTFDGLERDQPAPAQLSADKQAQHSYRAGNSSRKTRQIMANIHHRLVVGPLPHVLASLSVDPRYHIDAEAQLSLRLCNCSFVELSQVRRLPNTFVFYKLAPF